MDLELTDRQREALERTRAVCREKIQPRAAEIDQTGRFPSDNLRDLHAAGLLQAGVPIEFGGLGAGNGGDYLLYSLINEEVAKVCGSTAQALMLQGAATGSINLIGSEAQRRRFFSEIVDEGKVFTYIASEPGQRYTIRAGTAGYLTTARRVDGGYVINGTKRYATNSTGADYLMMMVQVAERSFEEGLLIVVIPRDTPGVTIEDTWPAIALGQRGTGSGTVVLDDCFVADENVIGEPAAFFTPGILGPGFQFGFVGLYLGMAEGAFAFGLEYLKTRARPALGLEAAGEDPHVQYHVANLDIAIEAMRWLTYRAAALLGKAERDRDAFAEAAIAVYRAKVQATETVLEVANRVFQVCGTSSTSRELGADRFWRNARTLTLHDPVDKRRVVIAEYVLGLATPQANTR